MKQRGSGSNAQLKCFISFFNLVPGDVHIFKGWEFSKKMENKL